LLAALDYSTESQFPENWQEKYQDKKRRESECLNLHEWVVYRDVAATFDVKINEQHDGQDVYGY
jgi:hypothetical protein